MTTIEQITALVGEVNNSQDLEGKMRNTEDLATLSYTLAHDVGIAHAEKNMAEFRYKSALYKYESTTEGAANKNAVRAKHENKELYRNFIEAENVYRSMSLILAQTNVVIEQARQSISYLKKEYSEGR